jgi:hypothetical protein
VRSEVVRAGDRNCGGFRGQMRKNAYDINLPMFVVYIRRPVAELSGGQCPPCSPLNAGGSRDRRKNARRRRQCSPSEAAGAIGTELHLDSRENAKNPFRHTFCRLCLRSPVVEPSEPWRRAVESGPAFARHASALRSARKRPEWPPDAKVNLNRCITDNFRRVWSKYVLN